MAEETVSQTKHLKDEIGKTNKADLVLDDGVHFDASSNKAWKKSISVWYSNEAEFKYEYDLVKDLSNHGISTVGQAREALIDGLVKCASLLNRLSKSSPTSRILDGISGIGKTLMQVQVGQRIPKLYPSICVAYLHVAGSEMPEIDIEEIVEYCKEKSKKEKFLVLLDDTEAVFVPANRAGSHFVASLARVCPPEYANVVVQVFGSSQVLKNLIQGSMDDKTALKLGYKGYPGSARINNSKLPVYYPCSAESLEELKGLGKSIACELGKVYTDDDTFALTWYCSGIARSIRYYFEETQSHSECLQSVWQRVYGDAESIKFYHEMASRMNLIDKIKKWYELELFIKNESSMFEFMKQVGKKAQCGEFENELHLLATGNVKRSDHFIVPTFPICVLIECVQANKEELFAEGELMAPNVRRSEMEAKAFEASTSGCDEKVVQTYKLWSYQFSKLSGLPNLDQLNLALAKLPKVLAKGKAGSKYHGTICIDLLNLGVINGKIGMVETDEIISKFGEAYFNLCKEIAENKDNSIEYCNAFHRSGDEFGVICLFDDSKEFEMVAGKLARINFTAKKASKNGEIKVTAYGTVGGYYKECPRSMIGSFTFATYIGKSVKDRVAKHFGYANATKMKMDIKRKDGPVIMVQDKDVDILWKVESDK